MALNCAALSSRTDFSGYVALLSNTTNGNFSLVSSFCKAEICGALWGLGNPDISGIGMATGYLLESAICICLICTYLWCNMTGFRMRLLPVAAATFYDNALFFTLAIQVASVATLAKANFGKGADGMGAITMKIAWVVSTLTLLPLLPLVLHRQLFEGNQRRHALENEACRSPSSAAKADDAEIASSHTDVKDKIIRARHTHRLLLFIVCWLISFYPFFSRMCGTFGASQIGDTSESVISTTNWTKIEQACFENVRVITDNEYTAMTAFGAGGWLFIASVIIYMIILSILEDSQNTKLEFLRRKGLTLDSNTVRSMYLWNFLCVAVILFLTGQFWAFFRLRQLQSDMMEATGGKFPDGQWTFGQIMAIAIFLPVVAEMFFQWRQRPSNAS